MGPCLGCATHSASTEYHGGNLYAYLANRTTCGGQPQTIQCCIFPTRPVDPQKIVCLVALDGTRSKNPGSACTRQPPPPTVPPCAPLRPTVVLIRTDVVQSEKALTLLCTPVFLWFWFQQGQASKFNTSGVRKLLTYLSGKEVALIYPLVDHHE